MNNDNEIRHSFSRVMAEQYGVNAAIVLSYIGYKIERSKHVETGKRWYYDTFDALAQHYPYLSKTAVYNAVQVLVGEDGVLETGNFNKWKRDKTTWYAFKDERTIQQLQAQPIYFKSCDAVAFGIPEAVLLTNIAYWITENRKKTPDYQFHQVSALKLAEHIPFSRSTIQRALDNLVAKRILVTRKPEDQRKPAEYAFAGSLENVSPCSDLNTRGSNLNEVEQVPKSEYDRLKSEQSSTENITGSNLNIIGSTETIGGSKLNITGSNLNDITILVDNHLKDPCLKEACLKENYFKNPELSFSEHSPSEDADINSAQVNYEGRNDFSEPIAPSIPNPSDKPLITDQGLVTVPGPSPCPGSVASPDPKPTKALVPGQIPISEEPFMKFLDPAVHKRCWAVLKIHDKPDQMHEGMAEHIIDVIRKMIDLTEPETIYRLYIIKTQAELNAKITVWASDFLAQTYDSEYAYDGPENVKYRELFVSHGICFLNMGFHCSKFADRLIYVGPYFGRVGFMIYSRMDKWVEERKAEMRGQNINERTLKFASPDLDKENDPGLSAAEKMQVFNQSLQARNRIGRYDEHNDFSEDVVMIQQQSMNLARQFFQLNPALTPAHLNLVLDQCLKLPRTIDGLDPVWHAKNGYKISFLLNNLITIAGQLNISSKLPAIVPLPQKEESNI